MKNFTLRSKALFICLLMLLSSAQAYAVTVDAGDYTRLPDGTNLAILYLQHTRGDELYSDGDKVSDNAKLNVNLSILRGVHYMDIGKITVAPQFLLPIGELKLGGDLSSFESKNGVGDLIIAPTIHLLQDPTRKKAFAITPWLYLPTGTYDRNKDFNALGENRWKLAMQVGYITPIAEKWTLDLIGDVTFYGKNKDYTSEKLTLKQSPLYEGQAHLRYQVSPTTYLSGMLSHAWGGETDIDGVSQNNKQSRTKALLSVGHSFATSWQILGSYGKDLSLEEGVKEGHRFNLRLVKAF